MAQVVSLVFTCHPIHMRSWCVRFSLAIDLSFLFTFYLTHLLSHSFHFFLHLKVRRQPEHSAQREHGLVWRDLPQHSLTLGSTWWWYVKFSETDQKSFRASPASGNESWSGGRETLLILQESQYYALLELVDSVPKWVFSSPDLLQEVWFVHLRLENKISFFFGKHHLFRIESFSVDVRCVHRFQLLNVYNQYVTLTISPRVQSVSEEQSR